jgi:hypothetical protein
MKTTKALACLSSEAAPCVVGLLALLGWRLLASGFLHAADPAPVSPKVQFLLDEATGEPGDAVKLQMSIVTNVKLASLSVAINFDEEKLHVDAADRVFAGATPEPPLQDATAIRLDNQDGDAGNQAHEGWIYLELSAPQENGDLLLPLDEPVPLFSLAFTILKKAPAGFTPVQFANLGPVKVLDQLVILANRAGVKGERADQPVAPAAEDLRDGGVIIKIIGEVGFFVRGDSTMDRHRDISDPISTLRFLFQGDQDVPCQDAADANDDGKVDVSDAIYTLDRLFSDVKPFPEPNAYGPDPTEDKLTCERG